MEVEKSVKPAACSKVAAVEEICPWTMLSHHEFVPLRVGEGLKCGDGEEVFFLVKEEKVEWVLTKKEGKGIKGSIKVKRDISISKTCLTKTT